MTSSRMRMRMRMSVTTKMRMRMRMRMSKYDILADADADVFYIKRNFSVLTKRTLPTPQKSLFSVRPCRQEQ